MDLSEKLENIEPGIYVVAVSGGVDSMVLLDLLVKHSGLQLTVAHFEHGIREDSDADRQLVERAAASYGLPFVCEHGNLGATASEAKAREARYEFLYQVREKVGAKAIITAHHQDDLIETAVINMLRGTGRKGLSSLQSSDKILRPLLDVAKHDVYGYAAAHPEIAWREDSTNQSDDYLRNYVRHHILKGLGEAGRHLLLDYIRRATATNPVIDLILQHILAEHMDDGRLNKRWFASLPYDVSCEVMAALLRSQGIREFDHRLIARLVVAAKVAEPGKRYDINAGYLLEVGKYGVEIRSRSLSR